MTGDNSEGAVAIYEYIGTHVHGAAHGNCKQPENETPYVRTPAATFDAIDTLTSQMPPKAAYNHLLATSDVNDAPRNSNVVHGKKHRQMQKQRQLQGAGACNNFADEWLSVYNRMASDDFIRFVGALKNRVPNIILYTCVLNC